MFAKNAVELPKRLRIFANHLRYKGNEMATGLVLEGGGLRSVFTGGFLEYFLEKEWYAPYVIGTSAGACTGTSYVSKQRGRNKQVTIGYVQDPRYFSYWGLIRGKGLLGMDFIFKEIPDRLCPLDRIALREAQQRLVVVATDCHTGEAVYIDKDQCSNFDLAVRASSSLPYITPSVLLDGRTLVDGGVVDSIPIRKSIADGNDRNIVIVTREKGYRKSLKDREGMFQRWITNRLYGIYPNLIEALRLRNQRYNETLDFIERLEEENKVLVIRPQAAFNVKRLERDIDKLEQLYDHGYQMAKESFEEILAFSR